MKTKTDGSWFGKFAKKTAQYAGRPATFAIAILLIIGWAASGPLFGFSDTWQLIVNTSTTIVTFLMVFLIQNSQNRDGEALQLKLDELIKAQKNANNALMDLEDLSEEELEEVRKDFLRMAEEQRGKLAAARQGKEKKR
jgi:low affinity Fe/Cu permease